MVKILSQSGNSLADMYDVEGSSAGIEQLETRELPIVHELGATLFSERASGAVRRLQTAAVAQSTAFDIVINDLPSGLFRVLGVTVLASSGSRVAQAQVSLRAPLLNRDMPIFIFDTSNDDESIVRVVDGGAAANFLALIPHQTFSPNLCFGTGQPQNVGNEIALRGTTSAFGAGTVVVTALVYIGFSRVEGLSSRGIPIPGW